jgi:hypothetical protein
MIGRWLQGTPEGQAETVKVHGGLMHALFPKLTGLVGKGTGIGDGDEGMKGLGIVQACVINCIFAFYTGRNNLISRAIMMLNTLVGVLREAGLFRPEAKVAKQDGLYRPWALIVTESRKRYACPPSIHILTQASVLRI